MTDAAMTRAHAPELRVEPSEHSRTRTFQSLSVVIPTYNEAESIRPLYEELVGALPEVGVPWEVIWVDDGSSDDTGRIMREICASDERIRYVRFRRNFGKAAALSAGFERATGEVIVTMDGDLQDDPGEIERLLGEIDAGCDVVSGWKWPRKDPPSKRWPSKLFNFAIRYMTKLDLHDVNCGLKAYRRETTDAVSLYGDMHRYIPVLAHAQGFRVGEVQVNHRPRQFGQSKYSVGRFTRGFLDFLTVLFLTRYRTRPLHLIGGLALLLGLAGTAILTVLTILWFSGQAIGGRPLFFLGMLLLIVAVQLVTFGLLAEMVTAFFIEDRGQYAVVEEVGFRRDDEAEANTG